VVHQMSKGRLSRPRGNRAGEQRAGRPVSAFRRREEQDGGAVNCLDTEPMSNTVLGVIGSSTPDRRGPERRATSPRPAVPPQPSNQVRRRSRTAAARPGSCRPGWLSHRLRRSRRDLACPWAQAPQTIRGHITALLNNARPEWPRCIGSYPAPRAACSCRFAVSFVLPPLRAPRHPAESRPEGTPSVPGDVRAASWTGGGSSRRTVGYCALARRSACGRASSGWQLRGLSVAYDDHR
jgi:hypothetical protein